MPLSEPGILRYLVDHGLLSRDIFVDGEATFIPIARQHRSYLVRCGGTRTLFVKQPGQGGQASTSGLAREAAFGWLVATRPPFDRLQGLVPAHLLFDPQRAILVTRAVPGVPPHRIQSLESGFPPAVGAAVGAALAQIHEIDKDSAGSAAALIAEEPPWVLRILDAQTAGGLPRNSGIDFAIAVIGRHPGFDRALNRLRDEWRPRRLAHGDMKWDNCLIEEGEPPRVRIVDWEIASWSDPAWDAGSLIQDYVSQSLLAAQLPPQASPDSVGAATERAMAAIRPAVEAFWTAYSPGGNPDFLRRTILFAGARVLQTCVEALATSGVVTPNIAALLQLSHDLLERPERAATSFLGFR